MDQTTLKRLLRPEPPSAAGRRWGCPTEAQLSAYAEQRLPNDEATSVETHLADCGACLEQVAFLVNRPADLPVGHVSPELLSRARDLVADSQRPWFAPALRWGTIAAAACLALAVGVQVWRVGTPPPRDAAARPTAAAPIASIPPAVAPVLSAGGSAAPQSTPPAWPSPPTRRSAAVPDAVTLESPREGAILSPGAAGFRWQPVAGALYYEVFILTEDGSIAWQGKSDATSIELPPNHALRAAAKYFVWVRAYLASGGTVRSAAVSFHLGAS